MCDECDKTVIKFTSYIIDNNRFRAYYVNHWITLKLWVYDKPKTKDRFYIGYGKEYSPFSFIPRFFKKYLKLKHN